jgi:hypothetical protein
MATATAALAGLALAGVSLGSVGPGSFGPGSAGLVTAAAAAPAPVVTAGPTGQASDGLGGFSIAGLVTDTSAVPATDIGVTVTEYAASGAVLGPDPNPVTTELLTLAAGETGSFSADLSPTDGSLLPGFDHFGVTAITADAASTPPNHDFTVTVTSDIANPDGTHTLLGTVTNNGATVANAVEIDFTFFDDQQRPIDTDFTFPDNAADSLAAGATDTFDEEYSGPAYATDTAVAQAGAAGADSSGCSPCVPFNRISGPSRAGTAAAISRDRYPVAHTAKAVVLAREDAFPDALAGGPLAAHVAGPLLLTAPTALDAATAAEITRVASRGATVYLLGGSGALGASVVRAVTALGDKPVRIAGADRYATAVAIAKAEGNPAVAFEVTGLGFADALSAVPAAIAHHGAVLLTDGSEQAPVTANYLASLPSTTRYALGAAAAAADTTATAVFGPDRYATSAAIASMFFPAPSLVGIATGTSFPDALGAGADLGARSAPLLLVPPSGSSLPTSLQNYLGAVSDAVIAGDVFGGLDAVPASTVTAAQNALGLVG